MIQPDPAVVVNTNLSSVLTAFYAVGLNVVYTSFHLNCDLELTIETYKNYDVINMTTCMVQLNDIIYLFHCQFSVTFRLLPVMFLLPL